MKRELIPVALYYGIVFVCSFGQVRVTGTWRHNTTGKYFEVGPFSVKQA